MNEDFLSRRQQLEVEDHFLKDGTESWIRLVTVAAVAFPFIKTAIEECILDDTIFLVEPGNLKKYWDRYSSAALADVHAEHHRILQLKEKQESIGLQYGTLMLRLWMRLEKLSEPPCLYGLIRLDFKLPPTMRWPHCRIASLCGSAS